MEFEWDPNKERSNVKKRQVGFAEAKTVFGDAPELAVQGPTHLFDETGS